jgi:prepilin-type N-terminal cleavage/methylation domain-containing protein
MMIPPPEHTTSHYGFSLVELSIVLVILGLLTGGILTGQNLIRAAELRSVTTEFQQFQTAINTFKGKYFALPGDISNATSFWGTAGSCPGTHTTPSTDKKTCNGNGNGLVSSNNADNEQYRFWQHLANAELIEGTYTGVRASSDNRDHTPNVNAPASKIQSAGWGVGAEDVNTWGSCSTKLGLFCYDYTDGWLTFGGDDNSYMDDTALTAEELWNIDKKMDDGKPGRGKIHAGDSIVITDMTASNDYDADYLLNSTAKGSAFFKYQ